LKTTKMASLVKLAFWFCASMEYIRNIALSIVMMLLLKVVKLGSKVPLEAIIATENPIKKMTNVTTNGMSSRFP